MTASYEHLMQSTDFLDGFGMYYGTGDDSFVEQAQSMCMASFNLPHIPQSKQRWHVRKTRDSHNAEIQQGRRVQKGCRDSTRGSSDSEAVPVEILPSMTCSAARPPRAMHIMSVI